MYSALDISRYLINKSIELKNPISHLKLQKLLYYSQAYYLVQHDEPLYFEEIINWNYGPVVTEVYDEFKNYGSSLINEPITKVTKLEFVEESLTLKVTNIDFDENLIAYDDRIILDRILTSYLSYNAVKIMRKTHEEDPWKLTTKNSEIKLSTISEYYKENLDRLLGEG